MKKFKFLWTLVALPLLASCSHDDLPVTGSGSDYEPGKDGVYMSVTFNPNGKEGTRSGTIGSNASNSGVEVGSANENAVLTALIILTERDNSFIAASYVDPSADTKITITGSNTTYQANAKFDRTDLAAYYDLFKKNPEKTGKGEINVFIICNPSNSLVTAIEGLTPESGTDWVNLEWKSNDAHPIWGEVDNNKLVKGFIMTNEFIAQRDLPKTEDAWNNYTKPDQAFDLSGMNGTPGAVGTIDNLNNNRGAIKVHRMAARFDFRDGSQVEGTGGNGIIGTPFTYKVITDQDDKQLVNCKILRMALTNMSNSQYYFGRVSNNGLMPADISNPTNGFMLCGAETQTNYVVSTNAQEKYAKIGLTDFEQFAKYFEYPFFSDKGKVFDMGDGWDWIDCSKVIDNGNKDNYGEIPNYNVWRYVTENTLPAPTDRQINSQSTGVIFKARLMPGEGLNQTTSDKWEKELYKILEYNKDNVGSDKLLHRNADTDPVLYSLLTNNTIYVSWYNLQEQALADAGIVPEGETQDPSKIDRNAPLYKLCFGGNQLEDTDNDEEAGDEPESYGIGTIVIKNPDGTTTKYTDPDGLEQDPTSANYLWEQWDADRTNDAKKSAFKKLVTKGLGFALYQSSQDESTIDDPNTNGWGYYCYYYYWNRHNDNGEIGVMGPMEFAVVRNNVYKLMVTRLSTLGHPRIPENDPDDPDPDTPDESSDVYITVSVDVLPWVVRLNNIEF